MSSYEGRSYNPSVEGSSSGSGTGNYNININTSLPGINTSPLGPSATLATALGDGGVRISLDAYGSFGASVNGLVSDAFYNPVGSLGESGTVYESGVAIRLGNTGRRTFLSSGSIGTSGNLSSVIFTATSPTSAQSSFTFNGLNFALDQRVSDLFDPTNARTGSQLTQTYTLTNPGSTAVNFELIRYLDGDLNFDGTLYDRGGYLLREGNDVLFETDSAASPFDRTTFVGIAAVGGNALPGKYEIDVYSGLRARIIDGVALDNIITGDSNDADDFVDAAPYDLALALGRGFVLNPGQSVTYTTFSIFGDGKPAEISVNIAPVATNDTVSVAQNTPLTIPVATLLSNDSDADGDPLTLTGVSNAQNGSVSLNNNGTPSNTADDFVTFTPNAGFSGNASFNYTINDGKGSTATATVAVAVTAPSIPTTTTGSNNSDNITGTAGNDIINAVGGQDTVQAGAGDDRVDGGDGEDNLFGETGNDTLLGGSGQDSLNGGTGNDNLDGGDGEDKLFGEAGNDTLLGGNGQDTLDGGADNDRLEGGEGDDKLYGQAGNDTLLGGNGNDLLVGGDGDDVLRGGLGDNNLTGGSGSDIFVLAKGEGKAIITDLTLGQGDKLGLTSGITFADLMFQGNEIRFGSETLAILNGINTSTLTASNFMAV